ncbi:U3 small nucleolar RNA-associated protein 18 [Acrasis kona]|uniref:U3 small nucleolar RNA-associated protein 18 n=1 Tax=Acrasis kona TaxID=1008807 RepID=A0AAW2ZFI3_9EUKA
MPKDKRNKKGGKFKKTEPEKKEDEIIRKPLSKEKVDKLLNMEENLAGFLFGNDSRPIEQKEPVYEMDGPDLVDSMIMSDDEESSDEEVADSFYIDTKPNELENQDVEDDEEEEKDAPQQKKITHIPLPPAWTDVHTEELYISVDKDADDASIAQSYLSRKVDENGGISGTDYEHKMRELYNKMHPTPHWAVLPISQTKRETEDEIIYREVILVESKQEQDAFSKLQRSTAELVDITSSFLPKTLLQYSNMTDGNVQSRGRDLSCIKFHPTSNIVLASTTDFKIKLFAIDGRENPLVENFDFAGSGLNKLIQTHWSADGKEIYTLSEKDRNFMVTDLSTGSTKRIVSVFTNTTRSKMKGSVLHKQEITSMCVSPDNETIAVTTTGASVKFLSRSTKFVVSEYQENFNILCMTFSYDGKYFFTSGASGMVSMYDVKEKKMSHMFQDYGSTRTTSIALSRDGKYVATGDANGVVNVYEWDVLTKNKQPKPVKIILNLTTAITSLKFNFDSQLLAFASNEKENSYRLAHVPSFTVYSNFPNKNFIKKGLDSAGMIATDIDFNDRSDIFAVASGTRLLMYSFDYYNKK